MRPLRDQPSTPLDRTKAGARAFAGARAVEGAWGLEVADVVVRAGVDPQRGLARDEVAARRRRFGANTLIRAPRRSAWAVLAAQLASFIVALLAVAAVIAFVFGHTLEGVAVVAVIVLNAAIGFFTELRAVRSMEALRQLGNVEAAVRRDGVLTRVPAQELVIGDLVVFEGGDVVTADLRLVEGSRLRVDESALTGESVAVGKALAALACDTTLADRRNMLYKGTAVVVGAGVGVVVATGMDTELGRITALVAEADHADTPLEKRLDRLGRSLAWISIVFVLVVGLVGLFAGKPLLLVLETALALAVAAVPEGLPIVATIALARGMWRMARRNALIQRLAAVETLGSTNVILTDKTGTLTENRMSVARVLLAGGREVLAGEDADAGGAADADAALGRVLSTAALCTDASLGEGGGGSGVGDPMELALLEAARAGGVDIDAYAAAHPELRAEAFDPRVKMMATYHDGYDDGVLVAIKGAPEVVLAACARVALDDGPGGSAPLGDELRARWVTRAEQLGAEGMRLLAIASKRVDSCEAAPYEDLTFIGLVALADPPRADVREAIARCQRAGVRVVMVTGDQPTTACYVGRAVGLLEQAKSSAGADNDKVVLGSAIDALGEDAAPDSAPARRVLAAAIVARTSPEQKLRLVDLYQRAGFVAAMLGDGVNDAPALEKANIGVAMGQRGTQVAREAAAMVLQDDKLDSVAVAIEQGRVIFSNIRRFIVYLISCNLSEIAIVGLAALFNAPQPLLPLQILFLNLVTDVFPALALGVSEGDASTMLRPPRDPREPLIARRHWVAIVLNAAALSAAVLVALGLALRWLGMPPARAVTVSFLVAGFSQLLFAFAMASHHSRLLSNEVTHNRWIWGAVALCTALLLAAVYLPGLSTVMRAYAPGLSGWLLVGGVSVTPLAVALAVRAARDARRGPPPSPRVSATARRARTAHQGGLR